MTVDGRAHSMNPQDGSQPHFNGRIRPGPVARAMWLVIARAATLPDGEAERHVQACARQLGSSCLRRVDVPRGVDRLVTAVEMLQASLRAGARRRAQHDLVAVERLLEVFQEELLPVLRREGLL